MDNKTNDELSQPVRRKVAIPEKRKSFSSESENIEAPYTDYPNINQEKVILSY